MIHPEVLPAAQRAALERTGGVLDGLGFYLGGGTAVALRLGHRRSEDFDWFRAEAEGDLHALAARLRAAVAGFEMTDVGRGTLHGVAGGVRITLLEYPYPLLRPIEPWDVGGCRIASLEDLSAMKLAAVAQRGSRRDFVDIHALLAHGLTLEGMLEGYRRKYGVRDVAHVLRGLCYFDDAEGEPVPVMLKAASWEDLKRDLARRVREQVGG